jgi:hypothetical protein
MYVLIRDRQVPRHYFTYDPRGEKTWTTDRLEGVRFATRREVVECCQAQSLGGCRLLDVGRDGETVTFRNAEIQVFLKGGRWRCRVGTFQTGTGRFRYLYGRKGMATADRAIAYGRRFLTGIMNGTRTRTM